MTDRKVETSKKWWIALAVLIAIVVTAGLVIWLGISAWSDGFTTSAPMITELLKG